MMRIIESVYFFFGWDDTGALTGGIIFIADFFRTRNRNLQKNHLPTLTQNPNVKTSWGASVLQGLRCA